MGCQMIEQREDKRWEARCDFHGCDEYLGWWETLEGMRKGLRSNCWVYGDVWEACFCAKHADQFKKEKPACVARDGEFYTAASFREAIFKCPLAEKDTGCPAREYALWKYQYTHWITTRDVYKIHRSPEFLAACSKCLGESQYSVVSKNTKEVKTPGLKIIDTIVVMLSDEYRCHPFCSAYSTPAFDPWCERFDSWCVGGRRCQKCLDTYKPTVVNAEVTTDDRVDLLEKRVDKITEGYERMFSYLDIISRSVLTIIREKEERGK